MKSLLSILLLLACAKPQSAEEQRVEWVAEHAIRLNTVEAGSGFQDLSPLREVVGDARIVALGEPTHGNREVFLLKNRLIEYLVLEMGFNVLALECPFAEAQDINRYVLHGIGDPEKALAGIYYWTWDTEELLALIEWMRAYNAKAEAKNKLKFYGFDPQDPQRAARRMLQYLDRVDPALEKAVRSELGILEVPFSDPVGSGRRQWIPDEYDSASLQQIKRVQRALQENKEQYLARADRSSWTLARQYARQVAFYIASNLNEGENFGTIRDLGQAENIRWILNEEGEDAKVMVWAHNIHISNSPAPRHEWMGFHLKKWYRDRVKLFGFFFNQGEFTALDEDLPSRGLTTFSVGPAKSGSLENLMASAGLQRAVLDLSELPASGPLARWFRQPVPTRYSWGGYNQKEPQAYYHAYQLAENFDALVFLNQTSATQPLEPADYAHLWLLDHKLKQPANLSFEESAVGSEPPHWMVWSKFKRLGVRMLTSGEAYKGEKSLIIARERGLAYGEIGPNVGQVIDATPYRGKRVRLTAMAKAQLEGDAYAFIHLKVEAGLGSNVYASKPPLFDSLDKLRIQASDWKQYSIEAEVPEQAETITYSVHLRDFGSVWLDAVEIEVVE